MNSCAQRACDSDEIEELALGHLDALADQSRAGRARAHAAECETCGKELLALASESALFARRAGAGSTAGAVPSFDQIMARVDRERHGTATGATRARVPTNLRARPRAVHVAVAFVALVACAAGFVVGSHARGRDRDRAPIAADRSAAMPSDTRASLEPNKVDVEADSTGGGASACMMEPSLDAAAGTCEPSSSPLASYASLEPICEDPLNTANAVSGMSGMSDLAGGICAPETWRSVAVP